MHSTTAQWLNKYESIFQTRGERILRLFISEILLQDLKLREFPKARIIEALESSYNLEYKQVCWNTIVHVVTESYSQSYLITISWKAR